LILWKEVTVVGVVEPRTLGFTVTSTTVDPAGAALDVDALLECARECTARADSCFGTADFSDLARCSGAALDCADLCQTVVWAVSRSTAQNSALTRVLLQACAAACRACPPACATHTGRHGQRRSCDRACARAEQACHDLLVMLT